MSLIFLTSTGLSDEKVKRKFINRIGSDRARPVAIITTAASEKSKNKYAELAQTQFKELGFSLIDFIDIEFDSIEKLSVYPIIYVCGGNTFYLLYQLKKTGADKLLTRLLKKSNVIYVGVSAGGMILGPTIQLAATVDPDPNEINLTDLTGLSIIDFDVHPHYEPEQEPEIVAYEKITRRKVVRLSNSQAMIISGRERKMIG